jgi:Protein tyrosine and serine/threonine kinase
MSGDGDAWDDPKGKSISRGAKRRMEAAKRGPRFGGASGSHDDPDKPSEECKAVLFQALFKWFKETNLTSINRNYLALGETVGKEAFFGRMRRLFEDAISGDEWDVEKQKFGYTKWMQDRLVDALYNTQPVLQKYRKQQDQPMNDEELAAFNNKVANFCEMTKSWSKKAQKTRNTWQQGTMTEMMLRGGHLIYLHNQVHVSYRGKKMEGGYGTIQKCFIQNEPAIPSHWAFAAKTQKGDTAAARLIRFNAEAMALRSAHEGCIKWIAVHSEKNEGYTLWWNGGTIREMLRDEASFNRDDVQATLHAAILLDSRDDYQKKLEAAKRVEVFRKKRHELAWTFLNTMNNVHHCHTLHNDMSPDNILLHFPPDSNDKVYIGVCDWAMAGNFNDLKESLYIHESEEAKARMMRNRWWVAPKLNYVIPHAGSSRDPDFERRPNFTPKSEAYAVGQIAYRIYGGNLSAEYFSKQRKVERGDEHFDAATMDLTFRRSLEQLFDPNPEQRPSLNRIVNRFMSGPFNWPVPNVGDTLRSYTEA